MVDNLQKDVLYITAFPRNFKDDATSMKREEGGGVGFPNLHPHCGKHLCSALLHMNILKITVIIPDLMADSHDLCGSQDLDMESLTQQSLFSSNPAESEYFPSTGSQTSEKVNLGQPFIVPEERGLIVFTFRVSILMSKTVK